MSSRDHILAAVKANQPEYRQLPDLPVTSSSGEVMSVFSATLNNIGASVHFVHSYEEIITLISQLFDTGKRIIATNPVFAGLAEIQRNYEVPSSLADTELMLLESQLAVAENGAVWVTDDLLTERVLPFIAQNCAVIVRSESIVSNMHQAYERIGAADYGFGSFIAGPSKTADIEQSLVLGAHGPCSMTVFILM